MRKLIAAAALLLAACASTAPPPGGPVITTPPELVSVTPDSGAVRTAPPSVVFRFNRVIRERPATVQDLGGLVLISPSDGAPRVSWERTGLSVRPRRAWRPNTTYTVTLLPGVADLRGNVVREQHTVVFSTGVDIPDTRVDGIIFDWQAGRPAPNAAIEARSLPDSVLYVARADSTGRFTLRHLPRGSYEVLGFLDLNSNRRLEEREPYDTARVTLADSARVELLAFVHDTIPPGVTQVSVMDSVTLHVTFDRPILPEQALTPGMFRLVDADSVVLPITAVLRLADWEEARRAAGEEVPAAPERPAPVAPAQPARPGALHQEPARRAPPPPREPDVQMSRPAPATTVVLSLQRPIAGGATYRIAASGLQGLLRTTASTNRSFTAPERQAVPPVPAEDAPPTPPAQPPT